MPTVARCTPSLHANTSAASSSTESKWLTTRSNCRSLGAARGDGRPQVRSGGSRFPNAAKTSAAEARARIGIPPLRFASCSICASSTSRTEGAVRRVPAVPLRVPSTRTNPRRRRRLPPPPPPPTPRRRSSPRLEALELERVLRRRRGVHEGGLQGRVFNSLALVRGVQRHHHGLAPTYTSGSSARNTKAIRGGRTYGVRLRRRAPSTSQRRRRTPGRGPCTGGSSTCRRTWARRGWNARGSSRRSQPPPARPRTQARRRPLLGDLRGRGRSSRTSAIRVRSLGCATTARPTPRPAPASPGSPTGTPSVRGPATGRSETGTPSRARRP